MDDRRGQKLAHDWSLGMRWICITHSFQDLDQDPIPIPSWIPVESSGEDNRGVKAQRPPSRPHDCSRCMKPRVQPRSLAHLIGHCVTTVLECDSWIKHYHTLLPIDLYRAYLNGLTDLGTQHSQPSLLRLSNFECLQLGEFPPSFTRICGSCVAYSFQVFTYH